MACVRLCVTQIPLENGKPADGPETIATTIILSPEFPRMEMTNNANGIEVTRMDVDECTFLVAWVEMCADEDNF